MTALIVSFHLLFIRYSIDGAILPDDKYRDPKEPEGR